MQKKKLTVILIIALALVLVSGAAVYAVNAYGSKEDPLVAKSYLDSVLRPELENELKTQLNDAVSDLRSGSGDFTVLTLNAGQTVTCEVGCEILPRGGTLKATGSASPALLDTTSGETVKAGSTLSANHLYMVSIAGNGVTAGADNTILLISGGYAVQ